MGQSKDEGEKKTNETDRKWQREENNESCKFDSCRSRVHETVSGSVFCDRKSAATYFLSGIILSRNYFIANSRRQQRRRCIATNGWCPYNKRRGHRRTRLTRARAHVNLGNLPRSKCNVTNVKAVPAAVVACCCKCCNKSREPRRATSAVRIPPLRCART